MFLMIRLNYMVFQKIKNYSFVDSEVLVSKTKPNEVALFFYQPNVILVR